ncbi:MAG TPA: hypothetical protein VLT90_01970 [Terriglobales bacterium]|nr:hypothetical protein [Terriglobales bacterium]
MAFRLAYFIVIELRFLVTVPLEAEAGGIVLGIDKTGDAVYKRVRTLAGRAYKASGLVIIEFGTAPQAAQDRPQVSGQG